MSRTAASVAWAAGTALATDSQNRILLFPVGAASLMTGIHENTIRKWIRQRRIPYYGWRGCYRVALEDLLPRDAEHKQ